MTIVSKSSNMFQACNGCCGLFEGGPCQGEASAFLREGEWQEALRKLSYLGGTRTARVNQMLGNMADM